jgi:hypothetical protein
VVSRKGLAGWILKPLSSLICTTTFPIGSMYVIYGNIYHPYTPSVSIYISTMDPMGFGFKPFGRNQTQNQETTERQNRICGPGIRTYLSPKWYYLCGIWQSNWAANWTQFELERVSSKLGDFRHGKREETSEAWSMVRTCQNQMNNDLKMENWSTNFGVWVKPGF